MNPIQIAYFKHFLYDKDLTSSFIYFYRTRHIKGGPQGDSAGNPDSIEEYFLKTNVKDVIMKAFYFSPSNNNYQKGNQTFDYWKDIDDKWQSYMKDNESNFSNDTWPNLRKTFSILRQNWDIVEYWKRDNFESTEEVYRRMHIDLPLPEFKWDHGYVQRTRNDSEHILVNIHNAQDGDALVCIQKNDKGDVFRVVFLFRELVPYVVDDVQLYKAMTYCLYSIHNKKLFISNEEHGNILVNDNNLNVCFRLAFDEERNLLMKKLEKEGLKWDNEKKAIVPLSEAKEEEQPLIEFSDEEEDDPLADFDFFDDVLPRNYRLKPNEVSINFNNSNKITFNQFESKTIRESGLKFARLARNKVGDICLIINNREGVNLSNLAGKANNQNTTINSVNICGKLRNLFHLKPDYSVLSIEKLQTTQEFIIYKITKQ